MAPSSSPSSSANKPGAAQLAILTTAAAALAAEPGDLDSLAALAAALTAFDGAEAKKLAVRAWEAVGVAAVDAGQFALGVAAARGLEKAGEATRARSLAQKLAKDYGAGSKRVSPGLRPPPPPPRPVVAEPPRASISETEALAASATALDAAAKAIAAMPAGKLPAVPLVHALAAKDLELLVAAMQLRVRAAGDVVIDVEEEARSLFLVARGTLRVTREDHDLGVLRPGAFFGEIALVGGTRRTARVSCVDETWLLEIPRDVLVRAAEKAPLLADTLAAFARRRLLANVMKTSELFRQLGPGEREDLVLRFEPLIVSPGTAILREGEAGERLHVIVSGQVEVRRGDVVIARLVAGDVFGEMSLIGRKPATADVVAVTPTVTLSLDQARFDDIAVAHPTLLAEVYKVLVAREADQSCTHLIVTDEDLIV